MEGDYISQHSVMAEVKDLLRSCSYRKVEGVPHLQFTLGARVFTVSPSGALGTIPRGIYGGDIWNAERLEALVLQLPRAVRVWHDKVDAHYRAMSGLERVLEFVSVCAVSMDTLDSVPDRYRRWMRSK